MDRKNDKNGIDLSKSFEESVSKPRNEQLASGPYVSPGAPKIIRWLIKHSGGLIKNEKQASRILFVIIILAIVFSLYLLFISLIGPNIPQEALEQPEYGLPIED